MHMLNVKVITESNTHSGLPRESKSWDDVINVTIFKGALMLERFQEETEILDLADVIHLGITPGIDRKVTRG